MADLTVIVPSRGRPAAVQPLTEAFKATCTADTRLLFSIDDNDDAGDKYIAATMGTSFPVAPVAGRNASMVEALNRVAVTVDSFAIGFMGDDHLPRSVGWDKSYLDALREMSTGIVYGDDLLQGERIPTQVAMTADIVKALGWMAPPTLTHLYVDNFWLDLGQAAGCIRYLPDVIIEHRHPIAGKATWDAGYARVNDASMYQRDADAYERFTTGGGLAAAAAKVRTLRG